MCALSQTKSKGNGEVVIMVSAVVGIRSKKGVALLLSEWLLRCVVEWKAVSSWLIWVRVKIERKSWVFIFAYRPSSERSEEELELWSELNECVWSFGRNESVVVLGDLNSRVGNEVIEGMVLLNH